MTTKRSDLYNRMDYINSVDKSTLISILQNPFDDEKSTECKFGILRMINKSPILADSILNITKNFWPDNKRLNKKSDSSYYLLHKAKILSVMVECPVFMSNREENKKITGLKNIKISFAYLIMLRLNIYITEEL